MIWLDEFVTDLVSANDETLKLLRKAVRDEQRSRRAYAKSLLPTKPKKVSNKKKPKKEYEKDRLRNWTLYVLYLEHTKYYVGITAYKTASRRFKQHVDGLGAKWTKLHKPLGVVEEHSIGFMHESKALDIETAKTIELMGIHGVVNVRGGRLVATADKMTEKHYEKILFKSKK